MATRKSENWQDIRQKCLFRAFADINYSFADWYQSTQLEIDGLAQELNGKILPENL